MRWSLILMVLVLGAASGACAPVCKSSEAKVGDRCVAVHDSGRVEDDAAAVLGADSDADEDGSSAEATGDAGTSAQDSSAYEAAAPPSDAALTDSSQASDAAPDASADAPGSEPDAGCTVQPCVADACHPNPCGHGTCSLSLAGKVSCACDADWSGDGVCNQNTNPALSTLSVSAGKLFPAFKSDIYEYSVDLPLAAAEVTLTPVVAVPGGAQLRVSSQMPALDAAKTTFPIELNSETRVEIQVTADSGAKRAYSVVLRRTLVLQATIKSPIASHIETFGRELSLNGNMLVASTVASDSAASDGPRVITFSVFVRDGLSWKHLTYLSSNRGDAGSAAVANDWLVATSDPTRVIVHKRSALAENQAPWAYELRPDSGEVGFGAKVAVNGNVAVVASASTLHVYELGTWDVDGQPLQTRLPLTDRRFAPAWISIEGDWIVASAGTGVPTVVRKDASGWKATTWPGPTEGVDHSVSCFGGEIAYAATYGCIFGCVGTTAQLDVFARSGDSWVRSSTRIPSKPEVPIALDPNGFGMGLAQGPNMVIVGAPLVWSQRLPVNRMSDPFVPPADDQLTALYGAAYVFVRGRSGWVADAVLSPSKEATPESQPVGLGLAISYSDGLLAVSAPSHGSGLGQEWRNDSASGAIYIYGPDCTKVPTGAQVPGC